MLNNNVNIHCWSWREEGWFWSILPAVTDMAKGNRMVTCWANGVGAWVGCFYITMGWLFLYYQDSTRRILILSRLCQILSTREDSSILCRPNKKCDTSRSFLWNHCDTSWCPWASFILSFKKKKIAANI